MGRYLRRSSRLNAAGEVAVVDVVQPQCPALRTTRSRALAVQRNNHQHHHHHQQLLASSAGEDTPDGSFSYLQLRSRRLEKAGGQNSPRKSKVAGGLTKGASGDHHVEGEGERDAGVLEWGHGAANLPTAREVRRMVAKAYAIMRWEPGDGEEEEEELGAGQVDKEDEEEEDEEESVHASCGDDGIQLEVVEESRGERYSRETTPCSLIYRPDPARTPPGSTTRRRPGHSRKHRGKDDDGSPTTTPTDAVLGVVTTSSEMEEFFTGAEQHQQREFVHKYNFDVANECPLPGRYQWEKLQGGSSSSW